MPTIMPRLRRLRRLPNEQKLQDDRAIRQIEQYHKSRGYSDDVVEQRKRGLRNVRISGIEN